MMEVKQLEDSIHYSEAGFRLEVTNGHMAAYHDCSRTDGDILRDWEMVASKCARCGELEIPESIKTLWYLYNFDNIPNIPNNMWGPDD